MKKIFTLLLISNFAFISNAQDTTMVEQYCKLTAAGKAFSNKLTISIDYGNTERKWYKDYRLRDEQTGKAKEFNSVIDALNYMGAQGWTLVNAFPMTDEGVSSQQGLKTFHYYFKKLFRRSQVD